jgi:succinyl-diaminopimelate desuccinylase
MQKLIEDLCNIKSVSGDEAAVADWVSARLKTVPVLEVQRIGNTVVARTNFGLPSRVILAGHLDTVPISKVTDNFPTQTDKEGFRQDGDTLIWGRGTVDMKAGDALLLKIADKLKLDVPRFDLTLLFYDNEEVSGDLNGLNLLSQSHPELLQGDFAILGEPTNGKIEAGCNGTMRFDVITHGKTAHSGRAWLGENAIHKAQGVLEILNAYNAEGIHSVDVDGLTYREGLNATWISGGLASNMIPDEARVHVNYRFAPDKDLDAAIDKVKTLFNGYEIELQDLSNSARPGLNLPQVQEFVALNEKLTGEGVFAKEGWTDVARFTALGIPALNFGPGDPALAHADNEHVSVNQAEQMLSVLEQFLFNL